MLAGREPREVSLQAKAFTGLGPCSVVLRDDATAGEGPIRNDAVVAEAQMEIIGKT